MKIDGFNLLLYDFCAYCPDFEPEVGKFNITEFGESTKYSTDISCKNRDKCTRIVANLEKRLNDKTRNDTKN